MCFGLMTGAHWCILSCSSAADPSMLRPIGERLKNRAAALIRQHDKQATAQAAFAEFLAMELSHVRAEAVVVDFNERRALLSLAARSKALANELLLCAPKLVKHFRKLGLRAERIVVR